MGDIGEGPVGPDNGDALDAQAQADQGVRFFGVDGEEPRIDRNAEGSPEAATDAPGASVDDVARAEIADAQADAADALAHADEAVDTIEQTGGDPTEVQQEAARLAAVSTSLAGIGASPAIPAVMTALSTVRQMPQAIEDLQITLSEELIANAMRVQDQYMDYVVVAQEAGLELADDPAQRQRQIGMLQAELGFEGDNIDAIMGPDTLTALLSREYFASSTLDAALVDKHRSGLEQQRDIIMAQNGIENLTEEQRMGYGIELVTVTDRLAVAESERVILERQLEAVESDEDEMDRLEVGIEEGNLFIAEQTARVEDHRENIAYYQAMIDLLPVGGRTMLEPLIQEAEAAVTELETAIQSREALVARLSRTRTFILEQYGIDPSSTKEQAEEALNNARREYTVRFSDAEREITSLTERKAELEEKLNPNVDQAVLDQLEAINQQIEAGITVEMITEWFNGLQNETITEADLPGGLTSLDIKTAHTSILASAQERAEARVAEVTASRRSSRRSSGGGSTGRQEPAAPAEVTEPEVDSNTERLEANAEIAHEVEHMLESVDIKIEGIAAAMNSRDLESARHLIETAQEDLDSAQTQLEGIVILETGDPEVDGVYPDLETRINGKRAQLDSLRTAYEALENSDS